jgi:hypothetical protein
MHKVYANSSEQATTHEAAAKKVAQALVWNDFQTTLPGAVWFPRR